LSSDGNCSLSSFSTTMELTSNALYLAELKMKSTSTSNLAEGSVCSLSSDDCVTESFSSTAMELASSSDLLVLAELSATLVEDSTSPLVESSSFSSVSSPTPVRSEVQGQSEVEQHRRSIELAKDIKTQCKFLINILSSYYRGTKLSRIDKDNILSASAQMKIDYTEYFSRFSPLPSGSSSSSSCSNDSEGTHNTQDETAVATETPKTNGGRIRHDWEVDWPQPLVRKYCFNCGDCSTGEWRAGPMGSQTLCNACGLRWKKVAPKPNEVKMSRDKYKELVLKIPVPVPSRKKKAHSHPQKAKKLARSSTRRRSCSAKASRTSKTSKASRAAVALQASVAQITSSTVR
jgi:hypothetical protein